MKTRLILLASITLFACSGGDDDDEVLLDRDGGVVVERDAGSTPRDGGATATRDGGVAAADAGFDPTETAVIDIVEPMVEAGWYPSVAVAWIDGDDVYYRGFGDVAGQAPDEDTLYEIGSITKTFTGTMLASAVVRGDLTLATTAQSLLPPNVTMPSRSGIDITVTDLATHMSGLPRLPDNLMPSDPIQPFADYDQAAAYAFLNGYQLPRDPGAVFEYSNFGVALLGDLLAATASVSYEALLDTEILGPLDMSDTTLTLDAEQQTRFAPSFDYDGEPSTNWDLGWHAPSGALKSSTGELVKYARAVIDGAPLSAELTLATTLQVDFNPAIGIGLNWFVLDGGAAVYHNGRTGGYTSFFAVAPAERRAAIVLTNATPFTTDVMGFAVFEAVRGNMYDAPDPQPVVEVEGSVLDANVGAYGAQNFTITITRTGDALYGQPDGQPTFRLYPTSDRYYYLRAVEAALRFDEPDGQGVVAGFDLLQDGRTQRFERR